MQGSLDKKRIIKHISFLQFLGPIFVILGHSMNGIPGDGIWWLFSKQWIYIFHMPLFFFISGYLLSFNNWHCKKGFVAFIKSKLVRLIIPYLFWNLICIIPKFVLQNWLSDSVSLSATYILRAFIEPRQNILGHTWYLFAAFLTYLFTPLWKKIFEKQKLIVIAIAAGILAYILPIKTELFCMSDLHKDILFFFIGCYLGLLPIEKLTVLCKKYFGINIFGAILFSAISVAFHSVNWIKVIPCYFIIVSLLSLPICFKFRFGVIETLSKNSFAIYIMHWPTMLVVRILLYQILNFPTALVVLLMIICGYVVPNVVVLILRKLPENKFKNMLRCILGV